MMNNRLRCAKCGIRNTGWREIIRNGETLCPSCAQGVTVVPVKEMLEHRRMLLEKLEKEASTNPKIMDFRDEVRNDIGRLERRKNEVCDADGRDGGEGAEIRV